MLGQKNISHVVVGKDLNISTGARSALSTGQIGVYKNGSTTSTTSALSAGDRFKVVLKDVDGNLVESPFIDYSLLQSKNATNYSAATEQITYIGYNGTSGSIAINNSDVYSIYVTLKDNTKTFGEHPLFKLGAVYKSDATATEKEILEGLLSNLVKNFAIEKTRSGYQSIRPGAICSTAVVASNDLINDATVVKDDAFLTSAATAQVDTITLSGTSGTANVGAAGGLTKLATFDTNLATTAANFVTAHAAAYAVVGITLTSTSSGPTDGKLVFTAATAGTAFTNPTIVNATGDLGGSVANTQANVVAFQYATSSTLAVGDYLRIGSVGGGTALTSKVYKVTAISGTTGTATVTLDRAIEEASGTYAAATSDIEVIPAATAANAATNWGIVLTGQALKFSPGKFKYSKLVFDVTVNDAFESTTLTTSQEATKGTGTYNEVAEIEWLLKGNRGETYRVASYPVDNTLNAVSGKTYDVIVLDFTNNNAKDIQGTVSSFISLIIFTEDESVGTPHTTLKTVFGIS